MSKYILVDRKPKKVTLNEWADWFENADRRVARTNFDDGGYVSTVFLGLDHQFDPHGEPEIFESMVFRSGNEHDGECRRYATWAQAEAGHEELVRLVRESQEKRGTGA